ncbi:MAG: EAL domain-containing protein [Trichocoleus desertorum ATA4-8-CV12]|jgi:diguanylate cyclase (GGDEF)-like protein|nr:EAL domain-containing protein [Trichocoleus desertorum ATA4-8-CV12]
MNVSQAEPTPADILVVDDTPENLRLLATILSKEGYNVRKALNGTMALTAVQTVQPDLILLDIMMPEMDGYEVCHHLKANSQTARVPVIFLSALNEGLDKAKAFDVGGADYITKPFQVQEVLARVQNQLALRASELKNEELNTQLEARVKERTYQLEIANQELQQQVYERQQLQAKLLKMALHDALTDLPNRALFMERLVQALRQAKAEADDQFAVLFLDCDRFKVVNDSLGHLVGDELLVAIARRLEQCLRPHHTLARLGGDEFAILLTNITNLDSATQVADQILNALAHPFKLARYEVFINASIGITLNHAEHKQPEHLLRDADTAMYRAKALGRGQYQVFDPMMHTKALQLLHLETDLRRAIQQQEFVVHYQPIVALHNHRLIGFEALVRWQHPQQGLLSPATFIPIAEETGLITQIGYWVLREACQQLCQWQANSLPDLALSISVNLSARQVAQPDLVEQIDQILADTQVNPQALKLEITESVIMENPQSASVMFQELRERQIQLSIDDFGTGYSSLSYLHSFPINILKIDRSFVQRLADGSEGSGLVPLIINIAHSLGLTVVAEGIETTEQLAQLKALGCDFGQGYLFSKPVAVEQAAELIASTPPWLDLNPNSVPLAKTIW